jgi:hypothetical protein
VPIGCQHAKKSICKLKTMPVKKDPCGTRSSPLHCYQMLYSFLCLFILLLNLPPTTNVVQVQMHILLTVKRNVKIKAEYLNHSFTKYVCSSYIVQRVYFADSSSFSETPDQVNL